MDRKIGYNAKLPNKAGDLSDSPNWRGVQVLSLPSKVIERLVLERIRKFVDIKEKNREDCGQTGLAQIR